MNLGYSYAIVMKMARQDFYASFDDRDPTFEFR